jgi:glycerol-3-phosphate O-acyltransferase/dihydroxyacetone phosphate acyltransferase
MAKDAEIHEHVPHNTEHKEQNPMTNWVYDVFLWTFSILVDLFFREVHPRGSWKVPRRGPLIFVAAPHANQVHIKIYKRQRGVVLTFHTLVC